MALGREHADLLHDMRAQGTDQLTGRSDEGVCEVVLPMLGCQLRPYMGGKPDVFAHAQAVRAAAGRDAF